MATDERTPAQSTHRNASDELPRVSRRTALMGGSAVAAAAASACCPCTPRTNYDWNNAIGKDGIDARYVVAPDTLESLMDFVGEAEATYQRIRMTGSGHSTSDVAYTKDILLTPRRLAQPLELSTPLRPEAKKKHLVEVQSGISIRALNEYLGKLSRPLALENMGGWDAQTIVGAAMTGTHGTGVEYGPIPSQIESMQIVLEGDRVVQLEPFDGITDPQSFSKKIARPNGTVDVELVQDDRLFHAATVSMGCMGIAYSVVLRVVPFYWLKERRTVMTWGQVKRDVLPGIFALSEANALASDPALAKERPLGPSGEPFADFYEIYVNPYPSTPGQPADEHLCLFTERFKLTKKPTISGDCKQRGKQSGAFLEEAGLILGEGTGLGEAMNSVKQLVPGIIDAGIKQLEDRCYINTSPKVFNLGVLNEYRAYAVELAFDIGQTVEAVERLFELAADNYQLGMIHPSPPSIRFVKAADSYLASTYGRDSMTMEIGMLMCVDRADELLRGYQRSFMRELAARPHWGLDLDILKNYDVDVPPLWGTQAASAWRQAFQKLNPNGTFDGVFTDRMKLR